METTAIHTRRAYRWRGRVATAVAVMLAAAGATVVPLQPVRATTTLACDTSPANGAVHGMGTAEHAALQAGLFIPEHEARCPQTVGSVTFEEAPDAATISLLRQRQLLYAGLNQPLSAEDWAGTWPIYHLPLMLDGFVVTANLSCPKPLGAELRLTPLTLSRIYSGASLWDQPLLVQDNPWLAGCQGRAAVSVRFGDAWATAVLKDYMSKADPTFEVYEQRERLDDWPSGTAIQCWGTSEAAMASCAQQPDAISYMRYATAKANGLTPVRLTNGDGLTPPPALNAADDWPSACPGAVPVGDIKEPRTATPAGAMLDWSTFSITNGKSYPLCGMGFVLSQVSASASSRAVHDAWKDHLRVMWDADSQDALKDYGYAPLPEALRAMINAGPALQG